MARIVRSFALAFMLEASLEECETRALAACNHWSDDYAVTRTEHWEMAVEAIDSALHTGGWLELLESAKEGDFDKAFAASQDLGDLDAVA